MSERYYQCDCGCDQFMQNKDGLISIVSDCKIVAALNELNRLTAQVETLRELLRECQPLAWDVEDTELSGRIDAALSDTEPTT